VDDVDTGLVLKLLEPLQGEGRAGTITQQALQAGVVLAFDPDRGIDREASTMVPPGHLVGIVPPEMTGAGEPAQHPSAHLLLRRGEVLRAQRGRLGELDLPVLAGDEYPVDHAAVEVHMAWTL
jgi:hypothetical protein